MFNILVHLVFIKQPKYTTALNRLCASFSHLYSNPPVNTSQFIDLIRLDDKERGDFHPSPEFSRCPVFHHIAGN